MGEDNVLRYRLWISILTLLIISIILAIFVLQLNTAKEVQEHSSLKAFTEHFDERIPTLMKEYSIPGVNIALIQKGKLKWLNAYGYADIENERKMTTDTYFRVESISKSVTAWGVMKLVENGQIDLDKPVEQYMKKWKFPESKFSEDKVTVRQLLSHSSGMPLGDFFERYDPLEDEVPSLEESLSKQAILMQEPGLSFSYSNTGFNVLELLVEEVTGRDFAEYMQEEIFIPLGMYKSSFTWSENMVPAVPVGYDLNGNPIPVYIYAEKASGGLFATVEDIATFVAAGMPKFTQSDHYVINPRNINKLHLPIIDIPGLYGLAFDSYGLGHFIETLSNGKQAVSHGGQGAGYMTQFYSVPETGDGIVILTNSQRSWPFFAYILNDWAEWSGFSSVGMSLIILGSKVAWTLIILLLFTFLWQVWRLGRGFIFHRRKLEPFSKISGLLRIVQISLFTILVICLLWSMNQEYLFISSVFPKASSWLGIVIFLIAIVLLLSALFPYRKIH